MHFCKDWQSVTFDWNQFRAFLVTAEEGSFSAASRALGLTQPTLGRPLSRLSHNSADPHPSNGPPMGNVSFHRG